MNGGTNRTPVSPNWHARINRLSPKRQELVRPVLEDPRSFVLLSIREMAKRLHTDTATTLRSIRGMGFTGYRQFRHYLHELTIAHATSLDSMLASGARDSDIPSHVLGSLDQDQKNFSTFRNTLDTKQLARLAQRMWAARRILVLGGDLAAALVFYLEHHLLMLGLPVFPGTTPGRVVHLVRTAGKKDLVLAISFHRALRQTVEGMTQAKERGAHCVGITDTFVSPIARFAHESLIVSVDTYHFGDSYVGPMALLNVMLVACANYRRKYSLALARQAAEEQQRGFRWYED
jgi:DNA-binding MurR/RpiR family transcriptional regulator